MCESSGLDLAPWLRDRDYIIFEQRGTRFAQPSLECPEVDESNIASAKKKLDEMSAVAQPAPVANGSNSVNSEPAALTQTARRRAATGSTACFIQRSESQPPKNPPRFEINGGIQT